MLTLIVPGLIWTRQALADLTCDLPLPAFTTLLGRGRLNRHPARDSSAMLAESTGLAAPLPAAALRWLALQDHPGPAEHGDWLCLDPVRLNFHERSLIVDDPQHLRLSSDEAAALAAALAPTLAALGRIEVIAPGHWNLRLSADAPAFQALPDAAGRSASPLPPGPAYAPWRQVLNEAQMILHVHPVNQARQAAGQPVVNSLWPWGGGRLPDPDTLTRVATHDAIWSDDPVARGIARLLRIDGAALPAGYAATAARALLALVDSLKHPASSGDAIVWRDELVRFEAEWLAPALGALRTGRLDALRLLAPGELAAAELLVSRRDLWKFWRKPRGLAELVPQ
ncbi:MAG: hypothetical protein NDI91_16380 [Sulfuritalea sp.]|nr:hypothetical protein [Sulfuritalea sp.]